MQDILNTEKVESQAFRIPDLEPRFIHCTQPTKLDFDFRKMLLERARTKPVPAEQELESEIKRKIIELKAELATITTVRKDRVFDSEVTEEEEIIIQKRVKLQQLLFEQYNQRDKNRKVEKVKQCFDYLVEEEILEAFEKHGQDEDSVICAFTQDGFLKEVRKAIAIRQTQSAIQAMSAEQRKAYNAMLERRKKSAPKKTEPGTKRVVRHSKLKLDEALEQLNKGDDPSKVFEGWSEARIKAYSQIHTKPNTYYYRFNAPGEKQAHGAWTKDERALFFKRLDELGADGQWGIFSMAIPGRVGYQCSNYYRHLLKTGEVVDENYTIDEKGNLHYLFGKKEGGQGSIRVHNRKNRDGSDCESPKIITKSKKGKKKRSAKGEWDEDEDDSGNFGTWSSSKRTKKKDQSFSAKDINPLPGFTDPITLEEVVKPAISPYGHVMGYQSWTQCIGTKNTCPITKKPLTKRELVLLTIDNIEEYRYNIVDLVIKSLINNFYTRQFDSILHLGPINAVENGHFGSVLVVALESKWGQTRNSSFPIKQMSSNLKLALQPPKTKFEFEDFVINQLGVVLVRPPIQEVCQYYLKNQCKMGNKCAFKHPSKTKLVVCKHWLRGLCKKGELCEFLHEYNLKKMPECWFFTKLGECTNPECQYLHIDPNAKVRECAWYARGFCKHGAECRNKHTRAAICLNYMTGFCPKGVNCSFGHPKYDLPVNNALGDDIQQPSEAQKEYQMKNQRQGDGASRNQQQRNQEVTCFKCGEKGHYANHCPKRIKYDQ